MNMKMFKPIDKEEIDRRYLGAVRFVDPSTNSPIRRAFRIDAPGLKTRVNRQFIHVLYHADELTHHLDKFEKPPADPANNSLDFSLTIRDPLAKYLPRIARIKLPRNPESKTPGNLFTPVDIPLSHAAVAVTQPNWSIVRVSVFDDADRQARKPVSGALIRLTRVDDNSSTPFHSGISDQRGEALIALAGIPITSYSQTSEDPEPSRHGPDRHHGSDRHNEWLASGSVVEQKTRLQLQVITHPELLWPVDSDELELNQDGWQRRIATGDAPVSADPIELDVVTGKLIKLTLFVELPN
jgi:hypothetical protein